MAPFYFKGRTFAATDRLKLSSPLATPPGAGLIGLARPASSRLLGCGFYGPAGAGGWMVGRGAATGNANRLGLYRPQRQAVLQGSAAAASATITTGSFTPPAYSILIAYSAVRRNAGAPTASTVTDSLGNTWTLITGSDDTATDGSSLWVRLRAHYLVIGASPSAMTVSSASASAAHHGLQVVAIEGGGVDFANVDTGTGASGAATATLPATPSADSMLLGAFANREFTSPITPPSGYSELLLSNMGTNGKLQTVIDDNSTAVNLAWNSAGDNYCVGLGLEMRQPALLEHSSAAWVDDRPQTFLAYSASASEHWLALDRAATLERFTTTIRLDTTSALALGRMDLTIPRGGFVGDFYWIGVLKGMPPTALLDPVLRQLAPPTTLAPWLAHLIPIQGRSPERCILTGASLVVDSGTSLATGSVMQLQRQIAVPRLGNLRYRARLDLSYGGDSLASSPAVDLGPKPRAAAVVVQLPAGGATGAGIAANGGALTPVTLPGGANAQSGSVVIGTGIVDGVAQSEPGTAEIAALSLAAAAGDVSESMWALARDFMAPTVAPIALVGSTGSPQTADLASYITDPSGAGYDLAVSSPSPGLTASVSSTVLTYQAAAESDAYALTLTVTSRHDLDMATSAPIAIALVSSALRYANGYRHRCLLRLPVWSSGSYSTFLLPIVLSDPILRSRANGGGVEHPLGWDIRVETVGGTKLPHGLWRWDGVNGQVVLAPNFARNFGAAELIAVYCGKPGLVASEEDIAGARAGGWLSINLGDATEDLTGLGRPWTLTQNVGSGLIGGDFPAGTFNGVDSYRGRSCTELAGLTAFSWLCLIQTPEDPGRAQEFISLGTDTDTYFAARFTGTAQFQWSLQVASVVNAWNSDTGYYVPGRPICLGGRWASGGAMLGFAVGETVDPVSAAPVLTGSIIGTGVLKLGAGGRAGKATVLQGLAGVLLLNSTSVPVAAMECMTAALTEPGLVYGVGPWTTVAESRAGPIAHAVSATGAAGVPVPVPVRSSAYNPDADVLEVVLPDAPDIGSSSVDSGTGEPVFTVPADRPNQTLFFPFAVQPVGVPSRRSKGAVRLGARPGTVTPGAGYDQSLPWGGIGIGAVCLFGQPGNQRTTSFTIVTARAQHTGRINRIAWYNKFNLSTAGYHTGDGGRIKWTLRKITSAPGALPLVLAGTVVSTPEITDPVLAASWTAAFAAAGGSGSVAVARFHEFPTLYFSPGLDVIEGDMLAFTHTQLDSSSGTVSINDAYTTKRVQDDWSPFPHDEYSRVFNNGSLSNYREEHFPELLYGYTDDMVCGNPHIGYANGSIPRDQEVLIIGGTAGILVRQVIPVPAWANGRRIRRIHTMMVRYDNTASADIRCRVRQAGSSPGGSGDIGSVLATATLDAAAIRYSTNIKGTSQALDPIPALVFDFGADGPVLAGGATNYVELSTTGGSGTTRYMGDRLQRYIDITPVGLKVPSGFTDGFKGQRNTGSGWASMQTNGSEHDIPVWVEFA